MYPSVSTGSLPPFSELDCSDDIRPDSPVSSITEDVDWTGSSLEEMVSHLESLDKHLSHFVTCVSQLSHDSSCTQR